MSIKPNMRYMRISDYEEVKWCYQIIDHGTKERSDCSVHEMYFDAATKRVVAHTENPIILEHYKSQEELIEVLEMILADLKKGRVMTVSEVDRDIFKKG